MAIEFKLPELGENVESGDVVSVLVSEGQSIEGNQGVVELETDKAVVEIPCPYAGKVIKIHVTKGETVKVGQTLLTVEADGVAGAAPAQAKPAAPRKTQPEPASPARVETVSKPAPAQPAAQAPAAPGGETLIPAGPAARRLARELGVDLGQVSGSGPRQRITPEDVQAAAQGGAAAGRGPLPGQDSWGPVRTERMTKIRKTIAANLVRSATTAVHLTNFDDADVTDLETIRKGVPQGFLGADLKLTSMPFVMRAVAIALRRHPMLNATLDDERDEIVYKEYVNLGVAVDTPRGLVVPVVRSADRLTIPQMALALASLAQRARAVQFSVDELRGGTFTISNLGAVGGAYSTPIINYPEVAILLVGRSRWMPVVRDGNIEKRLMMPLSLSYDHRLVDGATAARFLNEVIDWLQAPGKLLLTG